MTNKSLFLLTQIIDREFFLTETFENKFATGNQK